MTACSATFATKVPGVQILPSRLAAGPANVAIFEFGGDGKLTPRPDWTRAAAKQVDAAVGGRVAGNGGRVFVAEDVAHTDVGYGDFRHWSNAALQEVAATVAGTRASTHRSVAEWRFPNSLATWRAALGVDFVLVVGFVDAHETSGITSSNPTTTVAYHADQTGIACVVDLSDGRLVWCETLRTFGNLRTPEAARDAVGELVKELSR
jgi:hypothetical protein